MLSGCFVPQPDIAIPAQPPIPNKLVKRPDVILVLGSGGARGYAHVGVIKVLHDAGIPVDMIVGSSAGSVMGSIYADNGNIQQLEKVMLNSKLSDFVDLTLVPNLKGPITGNAFQDFLLQNMRSRNFSDLKIKLVTVATDIRTSETVSIESGPIAPAVLASAAIPSLVPPRAMYGHLLIDGGMSDPVPVDIARRYHPKIIIAVDLARRLPKDMPATSWGIYDRAYEITWDQLDELSTHGANVVIHPDVGEASMFDISQKQAMYKAGEVAALQALPKIRQLLAAKKIAKSSMSTIP